MGIQLARRSGGGLFSRKTSAMLFLKIAIVSAFLLFMVSAWYAACKEAAGKK